MFQSLLVLFIFEACPPKEEDIEMSSFIFKCIEYICLGEVLIIHVIHMYVLCTSTNISAKGKENICIFKIDK